MFVDQFGLCWWYVQSTGQLLHVDPNGYADYAANGYAGYGAGLNNPAWQNVKGEPPDPSGPLPEGHYNIGPQQDYVTSKGKTLYGAMYLTPSKGTNMYNRGGFLIHGPHRNDNHDSSNGCPIFGKPTRDKVAASGDTCLKVVP